MCVGPARVNDSADPLYPERLIEACGPVAVDRLERPACHHDVGTLGSKLQDWRGAGHAGPSARSLHLRLPGPVDGGA
jgi:hypothetical protein